MKHLEKLSNIIEKSDNIVFFGGAGVSTESDIPDFRSANGVFNVKLNRTLHLNNSFLGLCL